MNKEDLLLNTLNMWGYVKYTDSTGSERWVDNLGNFAGNNVLEAYNDIQQRIKRKIEDD